MGKKWDRFKHFDEHTYWLEICAMNKTQLQAEHRQLQISGTSASAGIGGTAVAGIFTLGAAWALTGVNTRRLIVTERQLKLVRRRLAEKGWDGVQMTKRDIAWGLGPSLVGELIVPAGGAVLGQAGHHLVSAGAQHAAQAAGQHAVQVGVQHAAENLVAQAPMYSASNCVHHASTFFTSMLQGAQSEVFVNSAGVLCHNGAQYFSMLPTDLATSQAQILGSAAGQVLITELMKHGLSQGGSWATNKGIGKAIERNEDKAKNRISVVTRGRSSSCSSSSSHDSDYDERIQRSMQEVFDAITLRLLNVHYADMKIYGYTGCIKKDIAAIQTCTHDGCSCEDYDDWDQAEASHEGDAICLCRHGLFEHESQGRATPVVNSFCEEWYAKIRSVNGEGKPKTVLEEIDPCGECDCMDYDRVEGAKENGDCVCEHGWGEHRKKYKTQDDRRAWIVGTVAMGYLQYLLEA